MTKKLPEDTKLLVLPSKLIDRLKDISSKKGLSLSSYAINTFDEAVRAESFSTNLRDIVEAYRLREIQQEAGAMIIPRSILSQLVGNSDDVRARQRDLWGEAGRWYGQYLKRRIAEKDLLNFIRNDLITSWNLDECEISDGDEAKLRFVGFDMSNEFTELLLFYLKELMSSIGFEEVESDSVRGMATIKYLKLGNKHS